MELSTKKIIFVFLSLSCLAGFSQGEIKDYRRASTSPNANYYKIVNQYRDILEKRKNRGEEETLLESKERKHFERWAYYWRNRVDSDGNFPGKLDGYYNAGIIDENGRINIDNRKPLARNTANSWVNVGPIELPEKNGYPNYPQMGRINTFWRYKHPTDESKNVLLVGAPTGGVWKSTDNGATWSPKLDQIAGIGVTDIASNSTDLNNPGVIYVSTGDYDGPDISSIGVYKSTDLGETFQPTGLTFTLDEKELLSDLVVINANTVLVGTSFGIQRTTNGGNTWSEVYSHDFGNNFGRFARDENNIICQDLYGGVYFSSNTGASWTQIRPDSEDFGGSACTVDEGTGIFYVQTFDGQVYSYNPASGGSSLTALGSAPGDYAPQGSFNQALTIKDGLLISGSVEGLSSTNNGASWYNSLNGYWDDNSSPGTYVHSDHHSLGTLDDGYSFFSCNDGGLTFIEYPTKTTQKPNVEYKSSGVAVTQIYSVAITPQNDEYYMIGNQDNDGYSREMHNGELKWVSASAGDGICTAIDYSDPNIRYLGDQKKNLYRTTTGFSGNYEGTKLATPTGGGFVWPLELHSTNPSKIYGGFRDINVSNDRGDSWTNLNSGAGTISFIETFGDIIMAVGKDKSVKSLNGGATWIDLVEPYRREEINSIAFNQSNPDIIYATVPAYRDGEKIYKSTDGGNTWSNITKNLPNIVMNQVVLYQNQTDEILFVGTELGVYSSVNGGEWEKYGNGLPSVIVNDIEINYTSEKMVVATFGRGVWQIDLQESITGVSGSNKSFFGILQNPVKDGVLRFKSEVENSSDYMIYNTVGGIVKEGRLESDQANLNIEDLIRGIYILKIKEDNNVVKTAKFKVAK